MVFRPARLQAERPEELPGGLRRGGDLFRDRDNIQNVFGLEA